MSAINTMQAEKLNLDIDVPSVKEKFPVRIGTTSYIIPADIIPNVRFLAPLVEDVELVLFESHEFSNLPDAETITILDQLQKEHGLSYTVHLPLDCQLGAPDRRQRQADVEKCLRTFDATKKLDNHAYILHLHGEERGQSPARDVREWQDRLLTSVRSLIEAGIPSRMLAVETLDYPFRFAEPIVEECDLSVCIDAGHLILADRDPAAHIKNYRQRCRVVHLHGVKDGKDHLGIEDMNDFEVRAIINAVSESPGPDCVLTLEVFDKDIFSKSVKKLSKLG